MTRPSLAVLALALGACQPASTSGWAGIYEAVFSASATLTLPEGGRTTLTDRGFLTISDGDAGEILVAFAIRDLPRVETVRFRLDAAGRTATAAGTSCFVLPQPDGSALTTCCEACTASLDGATLDQDQAGRLHGITAAGDPFAGFYIGSWAGHRL